MKRRVGIGVGMWVEVEDGVVVKWSVGVSVGADVGFGVKFRVGFGVGVGVGARAWRGYYGVA